MKNQADAKKLSFRTETIMPLQTDELAGVQGGATTTVTIPITARSSDKCARGVIAATQSTQRCADGAARGIAGANNFVKDKIGISF